MPTDNLKKVVLLVTKIIKDGESVFKDGFQFTDVFVFIPELSTIPEIIKSGPALAAELKALTPNESRELATYIESELVLENKKTEDIIESVIEVLDAVFNVVAKFKPAQIVP